MVKLQLTKIIQKFSLALILLLSSMFIDDTVLSIKSFSLKLIFTILLILVNDLFWEKVFSSKKKSEVKRKTTQEKKVTDKNTGNKIKRLSYTKR